MADDARALFCAPTPSRCQDLVWTVETVALLAALGIDRRELIPRNGRPDLRPREFRCPWFSVRREDPSAPVYALRRSHGLPTEDLDNPDNPLGSSRHIGPEGVDGEQWEQQAGDLLISAAAAGTGPIGQALRDWLELWGWQRPAPRATAAPPPMVA